MTIWVLSSANSQAQSISVTPATTTIEVEDYVENVLLGSCVTASNVTYTGAPSAAGLFDGNATVFNLNNGVLLTSGQTALAVGPDDGNSTGFGNGLTGDPDLSSLASGFTTYDASILEFDFIPQSDTLRFNYIFGSEEYPEYVNSGYNDVFGFFVSGPGISGPYTNGAENIALVPGTSLPVAIDNVNNGYSGSEPSTGPCDNCAYYVDNSSGPAVEYDGHTVVLTAEIVVFPCQTYHIKIAVADAGDGALDSGVFLEQGSFGAVGGDPVELVAVDGVTGVAEGCDVGSFVFRRLPGADNSESVTVGYNVLGTASPGVDYTALPGSITIPAGEDSVILTIDAALDFTPEGNESVIIEMLGGGCSCFNPPVSVSMDIVDNDTQLSLATTGSDTICLGQSVNLTALPIGSITPYTSGWDNGAPAGDNVSVSPTATTTYTYTVTDGCGGQSLSSTETIVVVSPDFSVNDDEQCFDNNSFSFTNNDASGLPTTHNWAFGDGSTSTDPNPNYSYSSIGTFAVTHSITHPATGCTASQIATIQVFDTVSVAMMVNQQVTCAGGSDGEVTVAVNSGTAPFTYSWLPNGETTSTISSLSTGNYTVTVTDANGCLDIATATVTQNDGVPPIALCQDAVVQLDTAGIATLSATAVDNGSSDNCGIASLVVLPNAFFCSDIGANPVVLTVTDVNGNTATCNATVTVEDTVPPVPICQDITVTLDSTGSTSITASQIENGSADNCDLQGVAIDITDFTCADLGANPVTLTATDVNGNSAACVATVTVLEDSDPISVCQDITVQLDVNGQVSIVAGDVDGGSSDNCSTLTLSVDPSSFNCSNVGANTVTLTVEDADGNTASCNATVTVEDNVAPTALCQSVSVYLDANGNGSLTASQMDAGSSDNCAIDSISIAPGIFTCADIGTQSATLTVVDVNGNSATCNEAVSVLDTIAPQAVCQDVSVVLDANGMATILPSQVENGSADACGISNISLSNADFDCSVIGLNAVYLLVEDASGNIDSCSTSVTVTDTIPPVAVCQDVTVYLDQNGNAAVTSSDADAGSTDNCLVDSVWLNPSVFTCADLGANQPTLTVSDESGNTADCVANITVLDTISPQIIDCPNDTTIISNTLNCGAISFWNEPTAIDNCSATVLGDYAPGDTLSVGSTLISYQATDASGNSASCSFTVTVQPIPLNVSVTALTYACGYNITCNGLTDGEATVQATGGCGPYTYLWSNGQTTETATGLGAGEQIVTVIDSEGNQAMDTIVLIEPDPLVVDTVESPTYIGGANVSCFGAVDGVIILDVSGGSSCSAFTFSWTGPNGFTSSEKEPEDLPAGVYDVEVVDANGCTISGSIELTAPDSISLTTFPNTYNGFNVSCFGSNDGAINLEVSGGNAGYTYQWLTGQTTEDLTTLVAGNYSVEVTDTNGCVSSTTVEIVEPSAIGISPIDTIPLVCFGEDNGGFTIEAVGGVPDYTYQWNNGDIDPILNGVGPGQYQVVVTDENGCQDSLQLELAEPSEIVVNVDQIVNATCYGYTDGSASISVTGGTVPYEYLWTPTFHTASVATGLGAGEHIYEVTDVNGCSVSDTILVTEPDEVVIVTSNDTTVCPNTLVPMQATVTGGNGTYLITWDSGQGFGEAYEPFITQTDNIPLIAVDQNGCQSVPNSVIVTTLPPVEAAFDYSIPDPCSVPFEVQFSNASIIGSSYEWTFSNGDNSTQFLPTTEFDTSGTFTASLVAISPDGCIDSVTNLVNIAHLPVANFNIPNPDGCFPINVGHFNASSNANGYFWDFGDGDTSDDGSPYHFYDEPGAYTVTLIASNNLGCSDTLAVDSAVFAFPRPVAGFTPEVIPGETSSEYFLNNTSVGATDFFWTFGNGEFSELFEPTYDYPDHGDYRIILFASNQYGCDDSASFSVTVDLISELHVPNAMVVGENGEAGLFLPKGVGLGQYHVWVFDQWGNQLWESTALSNGSPAEGWDGYYNGMTVPQGAYTWRINAVFKDGEVWGGVERPGGNKTIVGSVMVLY